MSVGQLVESGLEGMVADYLYVINNASVLSPLTSATDKQVYELGKHIGGVITDVALTLTGAGVSAKVAKVLSKSKAFTKLAKAFKGKFSKVASEAASKVDLKRPYIRKSVRAEVEARAPKTADGRFIDPNTRMPIDGKYDLGHKPGKEFWREKANAQNEGLTQKQFNDRMNNPDYYQIEDPASNRSHMYEMD